MNKKSETKRVLLGVLIGVGVYILLIVLTLALGFIIEALPTSKSKRQELVNYYSEDSNYTVIEGRANIFIYAEEDDYYCIEVTLNKVISDNDDNKNYIKGKTYSYYFLPANQKVLEENGIRELYDEPCEDYKWTYYAVDQEFIITVCEDTSIRFHPHAVALSAGGKEYLSYETGKANMVNYIANEMH